jgi:hypothetical protein
MQHNKKSFLPAALMLAILTAGSAFADPGQGQGQGRGDRIGHGISGTYAVKFDRACVRSPYRGSPAPAFFKYSTADGTQYGFVQAPAGMGYPEVSSVTNRSIETGSYVMVVNPLNSTITITDGHYHSVPLVPHATVPVSLADFGPFTGNGSFTGTGQALDVELQTLTLGPDGVAQSKNTNVKYRLETRDRGDNFFSLVGRGSIRLQHILTSNVYRDVHCTGITTGTRISRAF